MEKRTIERALNDAKDAIDMAISYIEELEKDINL